MEEASPSIQFPVETRFVLTDEVLRDFEAMGKDALMPKALQILLPAALVMQLVSFLLNTGSRGGGAMAISLLIVIGGGSMVGFWMEREKRAEARLAALGKEVTVGFSEEGFELCEGKALQSFPYSYVMRVGRDERGLALVVWPRRTVCIPLHAFASSEQRDFVYSHIGALLRKK